MRVSSCGNGPDYVSRWVRSPREGSGARDCGGRGVGPRPAPQGPQEPHQFALTPVAEAAEDDSDAKADGDDGRDQQDIAGGCPWGGHTQVRPSLVSATHPPSALSTPPPTSRATTLPYQLAPTLGALSLKFHSQLPLLADLGKFLSFSVTQFPHL